MLPFRRNKQTEGLALISELDSEWVTHNAINTITTIYNKKKEMRKAQYFDYVHSLPYFQMYEQYRGRPPLPPHHLLHLQAQIHDADIDLKRGIDADWKSCVVRYPEVLNHFYNQITANPPRQAEPPFGRGGHGQGQGHGQPQGRPPSRGPGPGLPPPPPRAPSVNPQAQQRHSQVAQPMMRSQSTVKKQRRQSKVNAGGDGGGGNGAGFSDDIFAQLTSKLAAANLQAGRGTPAPSMQGGRGQRPSGKRRESGNYVPAAPQPPQFHGGDGGFNSGRI